MKRSVVVALSCAFLIAPLLRAAESGETERLVALMAKVGASSRPSFSPDGRRIAFLSNMSGLPQAWVIDTPGGFPRLVTSFDDPVAVVKWSPDGEHLAISVAPGGGLNSQVYLVKLDGTGARCITAGGKENNWLGDWLEDGSGVTVASNRAGESMDAYIVDRQGAHRLVAKNSGIGELMDTSRDGRAALLYRMVSRSSDDLYYVDLSSGREILLTEHKGPGSFFGRFAPDGKTVYLGSNLGRDRIAFARAKVAGGAVGPIEVLLAREDAELDELAVNRQGTVAALLWNVAGRSELELFDLAKSTAIPTRPLPAEMASGLTFSGDGNLLAFTASGAAAPPDVWVFDVPANRFRQLTFSPHAGVDLRALRRPDLLGYKAHDGLALSGWLYRPEGVSGPGPIVLSFHGGPEGQERPFFNSTYQALLAAGISVFAPNVRGSSGFGKRFVNLDNGALRVDGVRDIRSTVDHLVTSGIAHPKKIGIMGGSYGGYMVMAGLTQYPELFAAGANLFGVVNFETFFAHTEPWMAAISTVEYGDPKTEADMLRDLSPLHRVDRVVAPTIVLHGANDTNVPVIEAEQVVASLKKRGVPVEYVLFPDEGHGWRKTPNRIRSTSEIVRWFERYLSGAEPGR
jgi:dipeptidyl aminopeptidase/acylaminoacyl peptidase